MENYTLALYRPILATPGAGGLFRCLTGRGNAADAYGVYMQALADFELDAGKYFTHLLGTSDNAFARAAHRGERLSRELAALVDYEMTVLSRLAMTAAPEGYPGWKPLKKPFTRAQWTKAYYDEGYGALYGGVAFTWAEAQGTFAAVKHRNPVTLDDLIDYDDNKRAAATNTEALLKGQPAQHVLLYGDRGTGKSSTVHALLNAYADRGLRLIGLSRRDLPSLPRIVEALRPSRFKFILLLDDLAFAEADDSFCELKAMLEGRGHIAGNVRVYATSNRVHLLHERFGTREDDVHAADTIEEQLALSDRFGLTLTYLKPDKDEFLRILRGILRVRGVTLDEGARAALPLRAEQFSMERGGRSPRCAVQLADLIQTERGDRE